MKTLLRLFKRDKVTFSLNIVGLVLGIGCFVSLQLYISNERNFDEFHSNSEELYRMTIYAEAGGREYKSAIIHGYWEQLLENQVQGIAKATKLVSVQSDISLRAENKITVAPQGTGFYVDEDFLDLFQFDALQGDPTSFLSGPGALVITEELALKIFDRADVMGENLIFNDGDDNAVQIAGVLKNLPANSHFQFDYLITGSTFPEFWDETAQLKGGSYTTYMYFETERQADMQSIQTSIEELRLKHFHDYFQFPILPVTDIHFKADSLFEHTTAGNESFVNTLELISYFLIFIAIINYIILSSSQMFKRAKEIGIRKSLGASKASLISYLMLEAILLSLLAGIIGIGLIHYVLQEVFPLLFDVELSLMSNPMTVAYILLFCLGVGFISGSIPALRISALQVIPSLKGMGSRPTKGLSGNSVLVIAQFAFTFFVVIGTYMVTKQLFYLKGKDLGYNKEAVINISRSSGASLEQWKQFLDKIENQHYTESVGTTLYEFIGDYNGNYVSVIDGADTSWISVQWNGIDERIIETMDLNLIEGTNFNPSENDDSTSIILNRAAAEKLNVDNLVGRLASSSIPTGDQGKIIGIVENFHFQSFDKEIIPIALFFHKNDNWKRNALVKFKTTNYSEVLPEIEQAWFEAGIEDPFNYRFLDSWFEQLIANEQRLGRLVITFSVMCVLIACLGLVGLVRYNMAGERKKIGIRKVFGASVLSILKRVNTQFLLRIGIAVIIAIPISVYGISLWLDNFAYKTTQSWWDYAIATFIILSITAFVITVQSWKTVHLNPAEVLKDE